jgi:hypothetical protein
MSVAGDGQMEAGFLCDFAESIAASESAKCESDDAVGTKEVDGVMHQHDADGLGRTVARRSIGKAAQVVYGRPCICAAGRGRTGVPKHLSRREQCFQPATSWHRIDAIDLQHRIGTGRPHLDHVGPWAGESVDFLNCLQTMRSVV